MADPEIEETIAQMRDVANPMDGNCGSFAVALSRLYPGGRFIGVTARERSTVNGFTLFDHVAYEIDDVLYDGSGAINQDELGSWCRDGEPKIVTYDADQRNVENEIMGGCGDDGIEPDDYLDVVTEFFADPE